MRILGTFGAFAFLIHSSFAKLKMLSTWLDLNGHVIWYWVFCFLFNIFQTGIDSVVRSDVCVCVCVCAYVRMCVSVCVCVYLEGICLVVICFQVDNFNTDSNALPGGHTKIFTQEWQMIPGPVLICQYTLNISVTWMKCSNIIPHFDYLAMNIFCAFVKVNLVGYKWLCNICFFRLEKTPLKLWWKRREFNEEETRGNEQRSSPAAFS